MTNHSINFWTTPNWQREGSVSPNFLMAVTIAFFLILSLMYFTVAQSQRRRVRDQLVVLQNNADSIAPAAQQLKSLVEEAEFWQKKLDILNEKSNNRLFWSHQLAIIQRKTPSHIILTNLVVRDESLRMETPAPPPPPGTPRQTRPPTIEYYTIHHLHLTAIATGDNIEQDIADFARELGHSQGTGLGPNLTGYEIRNISDLSGPNAQLYPGGKSFVIHCTYKRIKEVL